MSRAKPQKRAYDATGRRAAAALARERIVEVAAELLRKVRPEALSFADMAAKAGTSVRTVYRHFDRPEALVQEVARRFIARFLGPQGRVAESLPDVPPQLARMHSMLSEDPSAYRLFFSVPSRSGAGLSGAVEKWTEEALRPIPPEHHAAVRGLVELVVGPYAWDTLHSQWKVPPARITRASLAAVQVLLDGLAAHPEWLDENAEPPPRFQRATTVPATSPVRRPRKARK